MAICKKEALRRRRSNQRRRLLLEESAPTASEWYGGNIPSPVSFTTTGFNRYWQSGAHQAFASNAHWNSDGTAVHFLTQPGFATSGNLLRHTVETAFTMENFNDGEWENIDSFNVDANTPRGWTWWDNGQSILVSSQSLTADELKVFPINNTTRGDFDVDTQNLFDDGAATSAVTQSLTCAANDGNPTNVVVKYDGTMMAYLSVEPATNKVVYGTMSTAWDLSTWSKDGEWSPSGAAPGLWNMSNDGLQSYVYANGFVYTYTLTTAWDMSTAPDAAASFVNVDSQKWGTQSWYSAIQIDGSGQLCMWGGDTQSDQCLIHTFPNND